MGFWTALEEGAWLLRPGPRPNLGEHALRPGERQVLLRREEKEPARLADVLLRSGGAQEVPAPCRARRDGEDVELLDTESFGVFLGLRVCRVSFQLQRETL